MALVASNNRRNCLRHLALLSTLIQSNQRRNHLCHPLFFQSMKAAQAIRTIQIVVSPTLSLLSTLNLRYSKPKCRLWVLFLQIPITK